MKKLCYVATIPAVIHAFLRVHIEEMSKIYEVTVVCNSADKYLLEGIPARVIFLSIERKPSFLLDALVLFQLVELFSRERFDIVHSIMPKTGMLAMLAARLANIPIRIHTFTGQVWVTKRGAKRALLKWFDKLIGQFSSCVLTDSPSQRDFLLSEGVFPPDKAQVIGFGSICGVNASRFRPNPQTRISLRHDLGIAADAMVILFVGRLNVEKGVLDLASAFSSIAESHPDLVLLFVGSEEDVSCVQIENICRPWDNRVHYVAFTPAPEHYMMAADIFCLPSVREGFGMTIIEAAACAVPSVASRIYGITDAVADGKSGLLFPVGDVSALTQALVELIDDNAMRLQMGNAARVRAVELFSSELITGEMLNLYDNLLQG